MIISIHDFSQSKKNYDICVIYMFALNPARPTHISTHAIFMKFWYDAKEPKELLWVNFGVSSLIRNNFFNDDYICSHWA